MPSKFNAMKRIILNTCWLLIALFTMPWASAQAPDGESKPTGLRVKTDQAITIYADYMGQPNPYARYTLNNVYFFTVQGDSVLGCDEGPLAGIEFVKIVIPGEAQIFQNPKEWNGPIRDARKAADPTLPRCPVSFPVINPIETQVRDKQLGGTFWVEISDLVKGGNVIGKVETQQADEKVFDKTYIRSRWFVSALAVPFKYRFSFKNSHSALTGESSIGASIGWTFARNHNFDNRFWLMGAGGLTVINPNSPFDDANAKKENNIPGATACFGIGANISKTQAGFVFGVDFADPSWEFNAQPWVAFSVGFSFFNPVGSDKNK